MESRLMNTKTFSGNEKSFSKLHFSSVFSKLTLINEAFKLQRFNLKSVQTFTLM